MSAPAGPVRLGIIGIGNMGRLYAQHVLNGEVPGMQLGAVIDSDAQRLEAFSDLAKMTDWRDAVRSPSLDAVLIATPHYSHPTLAEAALRAGKHVLLEKPVAVQKSECEKLLSVPLRSGQRFAIMFNQRGDPAYGKIRQLIAAGELGRVQRIQWTVTDWFRPNAYYRSGSWRATWAADGGGVLMNQCPHNLDLYQWLFGMPTSIRGFCSLGRYHGFEVEDDVTAVSEHADGARGVFITSTGEFPGVNRLEVAADRGRLVFEDRRLVFHRNECLTSEFTRETKEPFGQPTSWKAEIPLAPGNGEQHLGILKNFAAAILHGTPLLAPSSEGIKSVEMANAILMSSVLKDTVELPFQSDRFTALLDRLIAESKVKTTRSGALR